MTPEYIRTREEAQVNNYKDWGIQLGRRFRALKLWFVIRFMGVNEIKARIRNHIRLGQWFARQIEDHHDFELLAPVPLNTVCFRYNPGQYDEEKLNEINEALMNTLNDSGKLFMTHTKRNGKINVQRVKGQTNVEKHHVEEAWNLSRAEAKK